MSTNEIPYIHKWLTALFKNDNGPGGIQSIRPNTGVHSDRIPTTRTFPLILFNLQAGLDISGNATVRMMSEPLYQVKVVNDSGITSTTVALADRVDHLLQHTTNAVQDAHVLSIRREQPIAYSEPGDDPEQHFFHLGGLYRIYIHKA